MKQCEYLAVSVIGRQSGEPTFVIDFSPSEATYSTADLASVLNNIVGAFERMKFKAKLSSNMKLSGE